MSKQSDVDYYLESISIFYDEKLKFLSTKDNFLRCKGCPTNKEFKEEYDKVSLSCGGKDGDKDCGMKIVINFPKYVHYEKDMDLLKNELEAGLNLEKINEFMDVSDSIEKDTRKRKKIEEEMKKITDNFYKMNVQNKKKDIENFYRSRVEKTKRCREILKVINNFEESEKVLLRKEYVSLVKRLNEEYIEIKNLIETFQPYHMVKKPEVTLMNKVESEKKKIIKKKKKPIEDNDIKFSQGDIVHWYNKDVIKSGFIKSSTEVKGMYKIVDENQKTFYVPKDQIRKGEYEPEPQMEEEVLEEVLETKESPKPEKQGKLYYYSNSKENKWLSTFNIANPFKYNGMEYPTVEHAFHAQKVADDDPMVEEYRLAFSTNVADVITPNDAKKFGGPTSFKENNFTLRSDWNNVRLKIMEEISREYYQSNVEFIEKLINTEEKLLIHKGFRIDDYWGVTKEDKGENNHGKILMKLREEFKNA